MNILMNYNEASYGELLEEFDRLVSELGERDSQKTVRWESKYRMVIQLAQLIAVAATK